MYLDSKNKVTVGIGTYLRTVDDAKQLRMYDAKTKILAPDEDKASEFKSVVSAKPAPPKGGKWKNHPPATAYYIFTKLVMTPSDIGERWLRDVKQFQKQRPTYFKGFATYPAKAKQALTDIAYQYGASGAAKNAAKGKLKEYAEKGDWKSAATVCSALEGQKSRNDKRKALFDAADSAPAAKMP